MTILFDSGKIMRVSVEDAVKDAATPVANLEGDEMLLIDMEFVGDNFPQNDSPATEILRQIVERANTEEADYLLLF